MIGWISLVFRVRNGRSIGRRSGTASGLPDMTDLVKQRFFDTRIDLTGRFVADCVFDGCVLELRKTPGAETAPAFPGCVFSNCQLIGDGWPEGWPALR